MCNNEGWRLFGQEKYLQNETLTFKKWTPRHKDNDHDHCAFCFEKISNIQNTLNYGYVTTNGQTWICEKCFNDFKEKFNWQVK